MRAGTEFPRSSTSIMHECVVTGGLRIHKPGCTHLAPIPRPPRFPKTQIDQSTSLSLLSTFPPGRQGLWNWLR